MQNCAEIVLQTIFHRSSILSVIHHCIGTIVLLLLLCTICIVCGILCSQIVDLMYSYNKTDLLNQNQMIGHLHHRVDQFKGVFPKFKRYYNNKKNNRWHFNRIFTGDITRTSSTMWNNTSIMMSGKFANTMMKYCVRKLK